MKASKPNPTGFANDNDNQSLLLSDNSQDAAMNTVFAVPHHPRLQIPQLAAAETPQSSAGVYLLARPRSSSATSSGQGGTLADARV